MMEEGLEEFKGRVWEILPAEEVEWCEAPESATQSWVEGGGGVSAMVLKELANDCWSQPGPVHGTRGPDLLPDPLPDRRPEPEGGAPPAAGAQAGSLGASSSLAQPSGPAGAEGCLEAGRGTSRSGPATG